MERRKERRVVLRVAEREFDALVTMDRSLEHQQSLDAFDLGVVLITARSNRESDVEPAIPGTIRALGRVLAGELIVVPA